MPVAVTDLSIAEIDRHLVGDLVRSCDQRLAEGAARESVRKELSTIKAALDEAVKWSG